MQLQTEIDRFNDLDVDIYAISVDSPEHHRELKEAANFTFSFLSDPSRDVLKHVQMENGDISYRGFSIIDENGDYVFSHINDHFASDIDETEAMIRDALEQ